MSREGRARARSNPPWALPPFSGPAQSTQDRPEPRPRHSGPAQSPQGCSEPCSARSDSDESTRAHAPPNPQALPSSPRVRSDPAPASPKPLLKFAQPLSCSPRAPPRSHSAQVHRPRLSLLLSCVPRTRPALLPLSQPSLGPTQSLVLGHLVLPAGRRGGPEDRPALPSSGGVTTADPSAQILFVRPLSSAGPPWNLSNPGLPWSKGPN